MDGATAVCVGVTVTVVAGTPAVCVGVTVTVVAGPVTIVVTGDTVILHPKSEPIRLSNTAVTIRVLRTGAISLFNFMIHSFSFAEYFYNKKSASEGDAHSISYLSHLSFPNTGGADVFTCTLGIFSIHRSPYHCLQTLGMITRRAIFSVLE